MKFLNKICCFLLVFSVFSIKNVKSLGFDPPWGYPFNTQMLDFPKAMTLMDQVLQSRNLTYGDQHALQVLFAAKLINDLKFKGLKFWSYVYLLELIDKLYRDYFRIDTKANVLKSNTKTGLAKGS